MNVIDVSKVLHYIKINVFNRLKIVWLCKVFLIVKNV